MDAIQYPVHIWHGTDDQFSPFAFAQYKHEAMQYSTLKVFPDRGHLHLANVYEALFQDILSRRPPSSSSPYSKQRP